MAKLIQTEMKLQTTRRKKKKRNAHVTFEETTAIKVMSWMVATQKEFHSK